MDSEKNSLIIELNNLTLRRGIQSSLIILSGITLASSGSILALSNTDLINLRTFAETLPWHFATSIGSVVASGASIIVEEVNKPLNKFKSLSMYELPHVIKNTNNPIKKLGLYLIEKDLNIERINR